MVILANEAAQSGPEDFLKIFAKSINISAFNKTVIPERMVQTVMKTDVFCKTASDKNGSFAIQMINVKKIERVDTKK